ncbi:MAG: hypothetical protein ABI231_06505 [Candidatus Tumulicola sp.]
MVDVAQYLVLQTSAATFLGEPWMMGFSHTISSVTASSGMD